jgi:sugar phosphate isomerase/epimerase
MVAYEHIQEVGIEYLELGVPGNPALLKDMLADEDLKFKIGSFTFEIETDDSKVIDRFQKTCELCSQFEYEFFFSSTKTKGKFEKKRDEGYKVLQKLGDIAQSYGKFISMETHPPYCLNADEMLRTMEAVNHPAVKINFDTANIYYYNKLKPGEGINEMQKVVKYIGSMHLKESNGKPKTWFFPELGHPEGIVDFKKVFEVLDAAGFKGISTLELEGTKQKPLTKMSMDEAKMQVKKSADHLKALGIL